MGMIRNHYVGRTFIQPTQSMRDFGVRVKLNPVKELLKGKDIIIIEDSIIRGTTAQDPRQGPARAGGQSGSTCGSAGPAHRFPCHYGIDFSTKGELIARRMSVKELRDFLGLDSLHYLSLHGLLESTGVEDPEECFCKACFDGCYPVEFDNICPRIAWKGNARADREDGRVKIDLPFQRAKAYYGVELTGFQRTGDRRNA